MAAGDGLRATCPYFKARVEWFGGSYIECVAMKPWMESFAPAIVNHYHIFSMEHFLSIHGRERRDEVYKTNCCDGGNCVIRELFEQGGLRDAGV